MPPNAKLVIYSAAIPHQNPELKKAKKLGITANSYAEVLGDLTKKYQTLAVAGSHGKSTTTALLSLTLIKAGLDPTVIIGAKLKEFKDSNFHNGKSNYLVLEADEYHESFLNYSPFAAIITNIDREHLDYYKNLTGIKNAFLKFINNVQPNGILVINKDDKNLLSLRNKIQKIAAKNKLRVYWYSIRDGLARNKKIRDKLARTLKILGDHNISNALAVYVLAKALKIKDKDIFNVINRYRGAWRRMEYRGQAKFRIQNAEFKIPVYDDYAHHPTEIKATLSGIAQKWPKSTLICVFQPHQAQRLSLLFGDFVRAFDSANTLVLLDIFKVRGRDKVSQNVSSKKLAEAINKRLSKSKNIKLKKIIHLPYFNQKQLPKLLKEIIKNISVNQRTHPRQSAIIVMMGAGDIYKITNGLI